MNRYEVINPDCGINFGIYEAESEREAIEACFRDAGYDSIAEFENEFESKCELVAIEVC